MNGFNGKCHLRLCTTRLSKILAAWIDNLQTDTENCAVHPGHVASSDCFDLRCYRNIYTLTCTYCIITTDRQKCGLLTGSLWMVIWCLLHLLTERFLSWTADRQRNLQCLDMSVSQFEPYRSLAGCNTIVSSCDGIWYTGTVLNWNSLPNNLSGLNIMNSICLSGFNIALTMYLECKCIL